MDILDTRSSFFHRDLSIHPSIYPGSLREREKEEAISSGDGGTAKSEGKGKGITSERAR